MCGNISIDLDSVKGFSALLRVTNDRPEVILAYHKFKLFLGALRLFESNIKLMKNKAKRCIDTFNQTDKELITIFERKSNGETCEKLQQLWTSECKKEEKSLNIWEKKKVWLMDYETKYGTDIFLTEDKPRNNKENRPERNISK
jgi:hypothetical protein